MLIVPYVLSPRDRVFRPDLSVINWTNVYVLSKNKKNNKNFHQKIIIFTAVKNSSILHWHVNVMF